MVDAVETVVAVAAVAAVEAVAAVAAVTEVVADESDELAGPTIEIPLMMAGGEVDAPKFQPIERMPGTPTAIIVDPMATRIDSERRPRIVMSALKR